MDDIDFIEEQETVTSPEEKMRLRRAFGDDVAQRFLRLRGIHGERMQDEVLDRYAMRQAAEGRISESTAISSVVSAGFTK